jgi:hypothetical protein
MKNLLSICLLVLVAPGIASANTYHIDANTSSLAGTTGSLDLSFNPGPLVTQSASVDILNVVTDGAISGSATLTGDVTGSFPASTLSFDNGTGFNDYFTAFTFGNSLAFDVDLFGPAISAPDGISTSGSSFALSIFSDPAGTLPALTTNTTDGFAYTVSINLDGTTTATDYLVTSSSSPIPEPPGWVLAMTGLLSLFYMRRYRFNR